MKRKLFFVSVLFLMCSFKSNAEENSPLSFASEFCEEYGIESYEELEEIYDMYITAVDNGAEEPVDIIDAFISHSIIEDDLGKDNVDDLLYYETKYGYGAIDNILNAVDEIGYSELTGDYSLANTHHDYEAPSSYNKEIEISPLDKFKDNLSYFWDRWRWYILAPTLSWGFIFLFIAINSWSKKRR